MRKIAMALVFMLFSSAFAMADTDPEGWITTDDPNIHFDANGWQTPDGPPSWPMMFAGVTFSGAGSYLVIRHWLLPRIFEDKVDYNATVDQLLENPELARATRIANDYDEKKAIAGGISLLAGLILTVASFFTPSG